MPTQTFGQWIQQQMDARRLKGKDCAARANVTPQAWSEWVNDRTKRQNNEPRRIEPATITKIALGLEMNPKEVGQAVARFGADSYVICYPEAFRDMSEESFTISHYYELPFEKRVAVDEIVRAFWLEHHPGMPLPEQSVEHQQSPSVPRSWVFFDPDTHTWYETNGKEITDGYRVRSLVSHAIQRPTVENVETQIEKADEVNSPPVS